MTQTAAFFGLEAGRTLLQVQMFHYICKQRGTDLKSLSDAVTALQECNLRQITGCTASTPVHALMSEAGLTDAQSRWSALAARMVGLRTRCRKETLCAWSQQKTHRAG